MIMITQKLNVWSLLKKSFLATACIACSAEVMAENEPEIVNGIKYSITDAKSVKVVGYEETLPSELTLDSVQINDKWYKVTGIGDEAFANNFDIVSFSAPNVESIGYYAFEGSRVTSMDFPKVTFLDKWALAECVNLTSVNLPQVKELPFALFDYDFNLRSVSLGEVTSIDQWAFSNCSSLDTLIVRQPDPIKMQFADLNVFNEVNVGNVTLFVPKGSKDAYLAVHQAMSINFKNVIEYDPNIDPNATYVVITEKDGKQTTVKVDADVKVEWMKGSEIK